MIREEIKWDFNQIVNALEAFVGNIELKLRNIMEDLPTFFINSGDMSYVFREKFIETKEKEIYLKTPRMVFDFDEIQIQVDQYSNQYNQLIYFFNGKNYICTCRRVPLLIPSTTNLVSSNFITNLQNFEVMSTISSRENVFTYEFMGNTFESSYNLQSPSMEKPSMDVSSVTRYFNVKTMFDLQVHILTPRIQSIREYNDNGYNIKMNIITQATEAEDDVTKLDIYNVEDDE
jgi:hypothetical protein